MRAIAITVIAALSLAVTGCSQPPQAPGPAASPAAPVATVTKTREELAKEAFELSGARQQMVQVMRTSFMQLVGDPRFAGIIDEEIKVGLEPVITEATKIYAEEFSAQELTDMIAFFNTPSGKTFLSKQPLIAEKIQPVGQKFGQELGERIVARAQREGLLPPAETGQPTPPR